MNPLDWVLAREKEMREKAARMCKNNPDSQIRSRQALELLDLLSASCCNPNQGLTHWVKGKIHHIDCAVANAVKETREEFIIWAENGTATSSKPKCECGADTTYGPGNVLHSATMPCPLFGK